MSRTIVLGIDAGTTGVRTFAIDDRSTVVRSAYREFPQHFPQPGWVEHDAAQIWADQLACAREAVAKAGVKVAAIGITNQRETTVLWDRGTGRPISVLPSGTPVSEVARRLMDLFTSGSIQPGTRLPPERHLATVLGVGRSAVREALAAQLPAAITMTPMFDRSVAIKHSVAPQQTVISRSGSSSRPCHWRYLAAMAWRKFLAPQVMEY